MTDGTTLTKTIFLNASVELSWEYLTRKDKLALWFHPASQDLKTGEDYALLQSEEADAEKLCWGTVLSMEPPHAMTWSFTVKPLDGAMTTVHWTLESVAGGTRLTLVHEGVGAALGDNALSLLFGLDPGWDEHFGRLRLRVAEAAERDLAQGVSCA